MKTNCIQVCVKYAKYEVSGEVCQLGLFRCFQCRSDQQPDCGDERFDPYRCEPCKSHCVHCAIYAYLHPSCAMNLQCNMHCLLWWKCVIYLPSGLSTRSVTISSLRAPLLASKQSNMVRDFRNNRHITSFNDVVNMTLDGGTCPLHSPDNMFFQPPATQS